MITLRDHIIAYFLAHPGDTLTRADAAVMWDVKPDTAYDCLQTMRRDGLVVARREGHRTAGLGVRHEFSPTARLHTLHHPIRHATPTRAVSTTESADAR